MTTQTGIRKGSRVALTVAAAAGLVIAAPIAPATADVGAEPSATVASDGSSDLSPSTQKAWMDFIEGGGEATGGAARVISGAYFGAPAIAVAAAGGELSATQLKAWRNFDEGAEQGGQGVAKVVSGAYVGAPGYIIDKIAAGAAPADLSTPELKQVSFMTPAEGLPTDQLPTDMLPLTMITDLLGGAAL